MNGLKVALLTLSRTLLVAATVGIPAFRLPAQYLLPADAGTAALGFQDSFSGGGLGANWVVRGANDYYVSGGALHVVTAGGVPSHVLYELPGYNRTIQEILARIRVLSYLPAGGY